MTLKVQILRCLRRLFIILVSLTMTRFSEKMLISTRYIHSFMSNLIKKSWKDSTPYGIRYMGKSNPKLITEQSQNMVPKKRQLRKQEMVGYGTMQLGYYAPALSYLLCKRVKRTFNKKLCQNPYNLECILEQRKRQNYIILRIFELKQIIWMSLL